MKVLKKTLKPVLVGVIFAAALLWDFSFASVRERRQNSCLDQQQLQEGLEENPILWLMLQKFDQLCCQNSQSCTFSQSLAVLGTTDQEDARELLDIFFCPGPETAACPDDEECTVVNDNLESLDPVRMDCQDDSVSMALDSILYILLGCIAGPVLIAIIVLALCCHCKRKKRQARRAAERAAETENARAVSAQANQTGNTRGKGKTKQKDEGTKKPKEFRVYVNNELAETIDVKERKKKNSNVVEVRVETNSRQATTHAAEKQTKPENKKQLKEKTKAKSKDSVFDAETLAIAQVQASLTKEKPAKANKKEQSKPKKGKPKATTQKTPERKDTVIKYQDLEPRDEMKRSINTYLDLTADRPSAAKEADYENDFQRYEYPTDAEITEIQSDTAPRPVTVYISMMPGDDTQPLFPESYDDVKDTSDGREVRPPGDIPYDNIGETEYVYMETRDDIEGTAGQVNFGNTEENFLYLVPLPVPLSPPFALSPSAPPLPPR